MVIGRNWDANRASDALQSTHPCGSPIDKRKWGLDSLADFQVFFEVAALSGPSRSQTTTLVGALTRGDETAANLLTPIVYEKLRALAAGLLQRKTLDLLGTPTAVAVRGTSNVWAQSVNATNEITSLSNGNSSGSP